MVFFVSCSNEVATSTDGLIDNDLFDVELITTSDDVVMSTESVDFVYSNLLPTYLLGDYTTSDFGNINASFVSQVGSFTYPVVRTDSETPANVTTSNVKVTLKIPLTLSSKDDDSDEFELDGITGDISTTFDFKVSTFDTSLKELNDDEDADSDIIYYSNGTNDSGADQDLGTLTELGSLSNYNFESSFTEADTLVVDLDPDYFKVNILDKLDDSTVDGDDEFLTLFKGLIMEATIVSGEGLVVPLSLSLARLEIEYTNEEDGESTDETLSFGLGGVLYNLYDHDHNSNVKTNEELIQGASGYNTTVDLSGFVTAYSAQSISEDWLINQGVLKIFVRPESDGDYSDVLGALIIYLDNGEEDLTAFSNSVVNTEDTENPYVEFTITNIMREALEDGKIDELRIKESRFETESVDLRSTTVNGIVFLNGSEDATKVPEFSLTYSVLAD